MDPDLTPQQLIDRSSLFTELQRELLCARMDEFKPLIIGDWIERVGPGPKVYETEYDERHGDEGHVIITGQSSAIALGYVYDAEEHVRRFVSAVVLGVKS